MFDAGSGGSDVGTFDSGDDRSPERRQYTLKGVESDTINLMRYAANKEGMKIGSWVSLRMREAAERALSNTADTAASAKDASRPPAEEPNDVVQEFIKVLQSQQEMNDMRFSRVERELHEITSGQRSILSALLADRSKIV